MSLRIGVSAGGTRRDAYFSLSLSLVSALKRRLMWNSSERKALSGSVVSDSCDPMSCSPPGYSVHGISQQEYWSWLSILPQGDLPDPEIEVMSVTSPSLAGGLFTTSITLEGPKRKESLVIKKTKWLCHFLPNSWGKRYWFIFFQCVKVKVAQVCPTLCVQLFATPWTIQFMHFSRPEYWSG